MSDLEVGPYTLLLTPYSSGGTWSMTVHCESTSEPTTAPTRGPTAEPTTAETRNCAEDIDGGGWTLVRHSYNKWPDANDNLVGTAEYGTVSGPTSDNEFAVAFDAADDTQFLFSNGDCDRWLITTFDQFGYQWGANYNATILKSCISDTPYTAKWYNRAGNPEDPWISYKDHFADDKTTIIYGENDHQGANIKNAYGQFINVWMREDSKPPSTATLTTHSDNKGVHSISNDGGASWTDIGTEGNWPTAFSYDLTGVSANTKIRVSVSDVGVIGGFIATVLFDGEQYSTTNPLQDGHWKLVSASDGDTSLIYKEKTSSPWGISTAEIASDAFWVWNQGIYNTLVFEFDFGSVLNPADVVSAGSSTQNVLFELSTSSEGGYVFELSTSTVRALVAALCVVVTVVLAVILCRGRSEKRRYRAVDVFGSDTEPITEVEAAKLKVDEV